MIAFLFLTYGNILHSCMEEYTRRHKVYIHAKYPENVQPVFKSRCIPTVPTEWGDMSIVHATLQLLKAAYQENHSWFVLLSEDVYPLQPIHKLEKFLANQSYSIFDPRGGFKTSQWWILTREDVATILETSFTISKPKNGAYDEYYFLSLLMHKNPFYSYTPYPVMYVRWLEGTQQHPASFQRWMEMDERESALSFFVRKTFSGFSLKRYEPQRTLMMVCVGTHTILPEPPSCDIILISLGVKPPKAWIQKCIYLYDIHWSSWSKQIEYLIHRSDIARWEKVTITSETFNWAHFDTLTHKGRLANQDCDILTPKHPAYILRNYKKIAFLFLLKTDIHQPALWERYFRGNEHRVSIYVHSKNPEQLKTPWLNINLIPVQVETEWGRIVGAYHELFKEASKDSNNMKFITISESCVPLQSFDALYAHVMEEDKTSYISFLKAGHYDISERIKTQPRYKEHEPFCKHLARFCLSAYHMKKLLQCNLEFFKKMPVGDEFFLSAIHPTPKVDFIVNEAITYDNWEDVAKEVEKIQNEIRGVYEDMEKTGIPNPRLQELQQHRDNIRKNPRTYEQLDAHDIQRAKKKRSFFWRKFTTMPLPWTYLP